MNQMPSWSNFDNERRSDADILFASFVSAFARNGLYCLVPRGRSCELVSLGIGRLAFFADMPFLLPSMPPNPGVRKMARGASHVKNKAGTFVWKHSCPSVDDSLTCHSIVHRRWWNPWHRDVLATATVYHISGSCEGTNR